MTNHQPCTKHSYKSERAAKSKLRNLRVKRRKQHAHRVEQRVYQCIHCRKWHLTSQSLLHGIGDGDGFR